MGKSITIRCAIELERGLINSIQRVTQGITKINDFKRDEVLSNEKIVIERWFVILRMYANPVFNNIDPMVFGLKQVLEKSEKCAA